MDKPKIKPLTEDRVRPSLRFSPPAGWMNDPNGTIWHEGYYHLFYQHNPFDDRWGSIHWGHGRSKNLVDWEHLPIALVPDESIGETSCFSGCCALSPGGEPVILYTSVGGDPKEKAWDQRHACSDREMIEWETSRDNPMLTLKNHGGPEIEGDWRDPYVFSFGERRFMVIGVTLSSNEGGDSAVLLYESSDSRLQKWDYKSIIIRKPKYEVGFFECPNFFCHRGRWILFTSPYRAVEYYMGDFDPDTGCFTPEQQGVLDGGEEFYATNTAVSPEGRIILFAWMRGFNKRKGLCGQMAFPRELIIDDGMGLRQRPVEEIALLRTDVIHVSDLVLNGEELPLQEGEESDSGEIEGIFSLEESAILEIRLFRSSHGEGYLPIRYDGQILDVGGCRVFHSLADPGDPFDLHILFDGTGVEVFLDRGRKVVTRGIYREYTSRGMSLGSLWGKVHVESLKLWTLRPGKHDFTRIEKK